MITAVDANVVIDVLSDDQAFASASIRALRRSAREGRVVMGEAALVEVTSGFADPALGFERVAAMGLGHLPMTDAAAVAAARARQLAWRTGATRDRLLPDFLIGGHALAQADRLLTPDVAFYRRRFPDLALFDPRALRPEGCLSAPVVGRR